jgi:hypothetical protein
VLPVGLPIQAHPAVDNDPLTAHLYCQAARANLLRPTNKNHLHKSFSSASLHALLVNTAARPEIILDETVACRYPLGHAADMPLH